MESVKTNKMSDESSLVNKHKEQPSKYVRLKYVFHDEKLKHCYKYLQLLKL